MRYYTVGNKARNAVRRMGVARPPQLALGRRIENKHRARGRAASRPTDFKPERFPDRAGLAASRLDDVAETADPQTRPDPRRRHRRAARRPRPEQSEAEPSRESKGAVEFSPSPEFVLSRLLPKYLEFTLYSAMLETDAAFFAAQLVAMTNATDNASKLIDELTIQ